MATHSPQTESSEAQPDRRPAGHWLWAVAVAVTVFIASGRGQVSGPSFAYADKVAHALVFGLIATLVARSFRRRRWVWAAIVLTSAYGGADEWRQSLTPGRSVELADWVADTAGAALAVTLYQCWPLYRRVLEMRLFGRKRSVDKSAVLETTESAP